MFYSLGDFFFEQYFIERHPSEVYDYYGLGDDATLEDLKTICFPQDKLYTRRASYEGLGAVVTFKDRSLEEIELIPLDLGIDEPLPERGWPLIASPERGREIIDKARSNSEYFGTEIDYDARGSIGVIRTGAR